MKTEQLLNQFRKDIKADIDDSEGELTTTDLKHIKDIVNEVIDSYLIKHDEDS